MTNSAELRELLCEQWCADVDIGEDRVGLRIALPLQEDDGDAVTVWIQPTIGGWKLRDCGTTFMRLSYEIDVDTLDDGQRARVLDRILAGGRVQLEMGELTLEVPEHQLGAALLSFGQTCQRVGDIAMWTRSRIASTFYEDLRGQLSRIVGAEKLHQNYVAPNVQDAASYPIDFAVLFGKKPLYIFGVPSSDKAKLTTIVLLHLQQAHHVFDSLIIPSDIDSIAKPDLRRLMNAANDFVDSSASTETIDRKIKQRLSA